MLKKILSTAAVLAALMAASAQAQRAPPTWLGSRIDAQSLPAAASAASGATKTADRRRAGADPKSQPQVASPDVLTTLVGDATGFLDTIFGVRDKGADDPDALPRE